MKRRRRTTGFMNWFPYKNVEEFEINEDASYEDMDPDKETIEIRRSLIIVLCHVMPI